MKNQTILKAEKPEWYSKRQYLHFDVPISADQAKDIVEDEETVARRAFYPFISYTIKSEKLRRNKDTGKLECESKEREVAYASHIDSHIYAYYASCLSEKYEDKIKEIEIHESVLAFRKLNGRNNIHFANDVFKYIKKIGECFVIALDISGFFDNLDHGILKKEWCNLLGLERLPIDHYKIFCSLTDYSKVDRNELFRTLKISKYNPRSSNRENSERICEPKEFREKVRKLILKNSTQGRGIPQGSPISALLSNIYMLPFDKNMKELVSSIEGKYIRYCDDMLFIIPIKQDSKLFIEKIESAIKDIKLEINNNKTEQRCFKSHINNNLCAFDEKNEQKPLQYLGFLFDGSSIFLRSTALARFSKKMKGGVRLAKNTMKKRNQIKKQKGKLENNILYKRKLYRLYTHRGKRNFLSYGYRAAKIMESNNIKKQLKPLWGRLKIEINK